MMKAAVQIAVDSKVLFGLQVKPGGFLEVFYLLTHFVVQCTSVAARPYFVSVSIPVEGIAKIDNSLSSFGSQANIHTVTT